MDGDGKDVPCGYGCGHIPMAAGHFNIKIDTWMPQGSNLDEVLHTFFLDNPVQLMNGE